MHISQSAKEKLHRALDSIAIVREDLENFRKVIEDEVPTNPHHEPETNRKFTERGFEDFTEFRDTHGSLVTVRESSGASEHCVWIFCKENPDPNYKLPQPHLNAQQARQVADALIRFADRSEAEA